ncbi:multicopper oxidase family protein [Sedimentitalea nanhaiensis]|uniref:Multicopper oxidase with three cupredoxin domains (Includes cell division protein FtsP and spore coat protein CotA) n=1 Tax=Sedimentitalea nanhaiensis TaxID=999627 RepID=A0A1I7DSP0_9RHOB|nr:multicopper oxidase family protein [Sedimentitalea nanhaiensis]SFU14644.1 Multicopper oxidase with three cupredoxin domains (includes cell division protein FtsP and spore coat protein CotA) [Sedimentitalea nanhaiensis]
MLSRRSFLWASSGAAAVAALPATAIRAQAAAPELVARENAVQLLPLDYPETTVWGYGGQAPGREIRVAQGDRIQRRFVNRLPQASSVHWHGLRAENAMDGVSGLTQEAVRPGGSFAYDLAAEDAGTFWYHSHNRSAEQVARGLYGPLIVDEPTPPDVDRDATLMLDDWRVDPETGQIADDFGALHDLSHGGRQGNFISTNGEAAYRLPVKRNDRLRLRIVNAANARLFTLGLQGLDGWLMAYDGMPVAIPEPVPETIALGPGQRVDLFVDITADEGQEALIGRLEQSGGFVQAAFPVSGNASASRRPPPAPLPPNRAPDLTGLAEAATLRLEMSGGAMGGMSEAIWKGASRTAGELMEDGQFWAFNGLVGMTETPLARLPLGQVARMTVVNDTVFPHAMHLHGMHFRILAEDGTPGPLRDTLLTLRGESHEIVFAADNPGRWAFHCHMLSHAASGMMTWIEVTV